MRRPLVHTLAAAALAGCSTLHAFADTFGEDAAFLKAHTEIVLLKDKAGEAEIAVAPAWGGRVMTSTAGGDGGASYGWTNHPFISAGKRVAHVNAYGSEDRLWIGPEGGQFGLFFKKGDPFELNVWRTPAPIDATPYSVTSQSSDSVTFGAKFSVTNYSGTKFDLKLNREIRLLSTKAAWKRLGVDPTAGVKLVAYESVNTITNTGAQKWTKDSGLLSIWILGQFKPSPATTVVAPIREGTEEKLGVKVTSNYFGDLPRERLKVTPTAVFFKGDGEFRSKIGINPRRAKGVLGSYDAANKVLTLVQFTQPKDALGYVNSKWENQKEPFSGDAANSYNDGPPAPGEKPLGPFYELETSSPALDLAPGGSGTHVHRTIHLSGDQKALDAISRKILGVSLEENFFGAAQVAAVSARGET